MVRSNGPSRDGKSEVVHQAVHHRFIHFLKLCQLFTRKCSGS